MSDLELAIQHIGGIVTISAFLVLLILESVLPLRRRKLPRRRRLLTNLVLTALTMAVWAGRERFGLLQMVDLPAPAQLALGFLLMDLTFYGWHRINHELRVLWRFHQVHHVDPDMDILTSFRFHAGEIVYSAVFRAAQVALLGVTPLAYIVYEIAFTVATMFHHSNLRLPVRLERAVNLVLVTPRMHGIHHSVIRNETDANYSVVLRWWDQLCRSLRLNVPQSQITIGVAGFDRPRDNGLWLQLALPFRRQRAPEAARAERPPRQLADPREQRVSFMAQ